MSHRRYRRSSDAGGAISGLLIAGMACAWIFQPSLTGLAFPWQVTVVVLAGSAVFLLTWMFILVMRRERRRRLLSRELYALTPTEFEERVLLLLKDLGWINLRLRGGSGDQGVDLEGEFQGQRYIVQ